MELTRLRDATESRHRKVERDLDLLRSSFTTDHYLALLRRFYGFHQPWESEVEPLLEASLPGFFPPRKKLRTIESDLRYLGFKTEDLSRIPLCTTLPRLNGVGSALGSIYVIEGSSLGGRILTRHFGEHLGVTPTAGCQFFAGYGESTGRMWKAFGELISRRPAAENDDILEASVSTFESLGDWLAAEVCV